MASLLHVYCPNCVHIQCGASPLTREVLTSMKEEDEAEFNRLISMNLLFVFCKSAKKFRIINIID